MITRHFFKNDAIGKDGCECCEICSFQEGEVEFYYWKERSLVIDRHTTAVLRLKTIKNEHQRPKTGGSISTLETN